jgi:hypothetical protein
MQRGAFVVLVVYEDESSCPNLIPWHYTPPWIAFRYPSCSSCQFGSITGNTKETSPTGPHGGAGGKRCCRSYSTYSAYAGLWFQHH